MWTINFPENILICGPSGCGKSTFVEKLLATPHIWDKPIDKIFYCYGIQSENVNRISKAYPQATLIEGLPPNLDKPLEMFSPKQNNLLIFDDLTSETQNNPTFTNFLIRGAHHSNCCLISLEHFLYSDSKERRKQAPHWHQIILFRNRRNVRQISTLAKQAALGDPKLVQWAYNDATNKPYSYFILDLRNNTLDNMRLLTGVLEEPLYVYF